MSARDTDHTLKFEALEVASGKAYLVRFKTGRENVWVPKSVFESVVNKEGTRELHGVREWFVEKEDLWEFSI